MDTMKLLLGATVALLLGAIAPGVKQSPPDEIARLKAQVAERRKEQDKLQLEKQIQQLKSATAPSPTPAANAAEIEAMKTQLEANQAALAQLEAEKANAARDAKVAQDEEGLLGQRELENADVELKRARMIGQALLIGRVKEFVDAEFGGCVTFEGLMPEVIEPGNDNGGGNNTRCGN